MRCNRSLVAFPAILALAMASGCGDPAKTTKTTKTGETDYGHGPGPHQGQIIELGDEEYHAELVHDDKAGTVTIYILDGTAKKAAPIEASDVTINIKHKQPEQFKLEAAPDEGDPAGKSSRFVSKDRHLDDDLDAKDIPAELVVVVAGKTYRGKIEHHPH